jgi:hypothetical protein
VAFVISHRFEQPAIFPFWVIGGGVGSRGFHRFYSLPRDFGGSPELPAYHVRTNIHDPCLAATKLSILTSVAKTWGKGGGMAWKYGPRARFHPFEF